MTDSEASTICSGSDPEEFVSDPDALQLVSDIQNQVSAIRNIQAEMNLPPRSGLSLIIKPAGEEQAVQFQSAEWIYKKLLPVESITFDPASVKPKAAAAAVVNKTEIFEIGRAHV